MTLSTDKTERKQTPMARGLLDYFPDALAAIAHCSWKGNQQHNPGEELHWARHKSTDHADCIMRHLMERDKLDDDGIPHIVKVAWRALAATQVYLEGQEDMPAADQPAPSAPVQPRPTYSNAYEIELVGRLRAQGAPESVIGVIRAGMSYPTDPHRNPATRAVYLAGPMRGHDDFNFPAFDATRDLFLRTGWLVISPADIDRNAPQDVIADVDSSASQRTFARRDLYALQALRPEKGDAIAMLPGWEKSTGATAEFHVARWLGLQALNAIGDGRPLRSLNIDALTQKLLQEREAAHGS